MATLTPFCLMEGSGPGEGLGSLNCAYLFSLLSLRALQREGNDSVRAEIPGHMVTNLPTGDKEEELLTGCPRGPTRPCGRKHMC